MDDLLEITQSLVGEHLSWAIDQLSRSRNLAAKREHPWSWIEAHRCALSSVIHSYCGFEAAVNVVGYELFFNPRSLKYVPPETRDLPLTRMVQSWDIGLSVTDKFAYVLSTVKAILPARLENELRELNNYRNWIAHGFPYGTTVLVAKQADGTLLEVDREDSVNWKKKFPNTKFQPLDQVNSSDAGTALSIVLACLRAIASSVDILFWVNPLCNGPTYRIITGEFDVAAYIAEQRDC
ncbi:MAG: hypothetical protein JWO80_5974 [Bryobacterales bacterium]|nr:hypothetical protein [Bryobacterales bacterium]